MTQVKELVLFQGPCRQSLGHYLEAVGSWPYKRPMQQTVSAITKFVACGARLITGKLFLVVGPSLLMAIVPNMIFGAGEACTRPPGVKHIPFTSRGILVARLLAVQAPFALRTYQGDPKLPSMS